MTRKKARTLKLKATKFCILNSTLYWKDPDGILLNCLVEKEAKKVMEDCHEGNCGDHLFWKSTTSKILRAGYYWLTLFVDVYKMVKSCHKCQIFEGKQKLQPLPLKPIEASQKKSIGTSPFELVYGVDTVFPSSLAALVVKLLQEAGSEDNPMQRRLNQMVHLQQTREEVFQNTFNLQEKIKKIYDRKEKADKFQLDDVVLKWDARNEEKSKHGKFENLLKGPFKIVAY
eukprot:PITA_07740